MGQVSISKLDSNLLLSARFGVELLSDKEIVRKTRTGDSE